MKQPFPGAVIFDMDGLMFDSERLVLVTWTRAMADFGYQASEEVFQRSVGQTMERTNRVLRGGNWNNNSSNARCANRHFSAPTCRSSNIGFRCARTP